MYIVLTDIFTTLDVGGVLKPLMQLGKSLLAEDAPVLCLDLSGTGVQVVGGGGIGKISLWEVLVLGLGLSGLEAWEDTFEKAISFAFFRIIWGRGGLRGGSTFEQGARGDEVFFRIHYFMILIL